MYEMTTHSGRVINLFSPDPAAISIEDIAHHLSHVCRWGGASDVFYSVAQHSVMVHDCLRSDIRYEGDHELLMAALLHDASEFLLGDIPTPLKHCPLMDGYRLLEGGLQVAVAKRFGIKASLFQDPAIKKADIRVRTAEAMVMHRAVVGKRLVDEDPWPPEGGFWALDNLTAGVARKTFLLRFNELKGKLNGQPAKLSSSTG